jgi:hypothetical protein
MVPGAKLQQQSSKTSEDSKGGQSVTQVLHMPCGKHLVPIFYRCMHKLLQLQVPPNADAAALEASGSSSALKSFTAAFGACGPTCPAS